MKQLPHIKKSTGIIGYSESSIAKSERNDCFVRAVASAYEISYDDAHKWVADNFKRENRKGTMNVVDKMTSFSLGKELLNNKSVEVIQNLRHYDAEKLKMNKTTLNQFIKKYSTGTYIVIVKRHAFTLKNGYVIGNDEDSQSIKKIVHNAYKIS